MEDWDLKEAQDEANRIDLSKLPRVRFRDRKDLPNVSGIYFVLVGKEEVCLYIGKANGISIRWHSHDVARVLTAIAPSSLIAWIERPQGQLLGLEKALVKRFDPPLNVQLRKDRYCDTRERFKLLATMTAFLRQSGSLDQAIEKEISREVRLLLKQVLVEGKIGSDLERIELAFIEPEPEPEVGAEEQKQKSHLYQFICETGLTHTQQPKNSKKIGIFVGELYKSLESWYVAKGILSFDGCGEKVWHSQPDPEDKNIKADKLIYQRLSEILPEIRGQKIGKDGKLWIRGLIFDESKIVREVVPEPESDEAG